MATYRVQFVASFNITIDAPGEREARTLASEMEVLPWGSWAAAADAHEVRCAWNIIEPLDADQP